MVSWEVMACVRIVHDSELRPVTDCLLLSPSLSSCGRLADNMDYRVRDVHMI